MTGSALRLTAAFSNRCRVERTFVDPRNAIIPAAARGADRTNDSRIGICFVNVPGVTR